MQKIQRFESLNFDFRVSKLNAHIAEMDKQANDMFFQLVKELAEKENITEELKSNDQMLWVQKMNNIRNRVTEIVNKEIIYA